MRFLLLGKDGQVGWELQRVLAPLGDVIALGRKDFDLSSHSDSIRDAVDAVRPTIIVNAAAYTAVDRAEQEDNLAFAINAHAPTTLAREAAKYGAVLIHYSTDYVFDGQKSEAYVEDDTTNPLQVYGRSKLAGEQGIIASGCAHIILRTSWVYGARGKNFLFTMLNLARKRPELRVVRDQVGVPTWSRMIAEVTGQMVAISGGELRKATGTYHLTATGRTSWHGFAEKIVAHGAERSLCPAVPVAAISTSEYPTPSKRPLNSALNNEKLATRFGIRIPAWDECLAWCFDDLHASATLVRPLTSR